VRTSLPYFAEYGWDPVVLAVAAESTEHPVDPLQLATIPNHVPVRRVGALPLQWTRLAGLGNIGYRSWFQLDTAGRKLLRDGRFDLVYFSTTQFVTTTLGARWLQLFGTPFVVDIQDPWRTDYYERPGAPRPPGGWKYRFARWQAARLEERAWRDAAGFVSVSPNYLEDLRGRYPWFTAKPAAAIPFGAPEADFAFVRSNATIPCAFARESGVVHVVSVGAVGGMMKAALELFFSGLAALRAEVPADAARLRIHFIGTSHAPASRATSLVESLAIAHGVGELVQEQPERIGYFNAIKTMLSADALLLVGSDETGYSPSKIGSCSLARRPTLALVSAGSAAAQRIDALDFAHLASPGNTGSVARVTAFLRDLLCAPERLAMNGRAQSTLAGQETARACTQRQCALFDRALHDSER